MVSEPRFDAVTGRYLLTEIAAKQQRIYVEQAGHGIPLLCLHTAGTDTRQYRSMLNDAEITDRFRVIAFDLPWHGKSSPPAGFQNGLYRLTADLYVESIMAVVRGLKLDKPVVMGCSIGGRIVLHLLMRHAQEFGAAIGVQTSHRVVGRLTAAQNELQYLNRSDVHGSEAAAGLVSGLMAPQSPAEDRWETLWHYMQGGPGVFSGDTYFYKDSGNLDIAALSSIDTSITPLYLLSGEYDYSSTPAMTQEVHRMIPGSKFILMTNLGHFAVSENYRHFRTFLIPVLKEIEANRR